MDPAQHEAQLTLHIMARDKILFHCYQYGDRRQKWLFSQDLKLNIK